MSTEYEAPPSPASAAHAPVSRSAGWSGPGKKQLWTGRVISGAVVAMMLLSATLKLSQASSMAAKLAGGHFTERSILVIGILELCCALVYVVPRTSVLGAVLLTGYLGGAIATHVLSGGSFAIALLLGVLAWLGLYLREARLHALLPLRR